MDSLVSFVISAPGLITAVVVAAVWLSVRPRSRAAHRFLVLVALAYLLASIYALPHVVGRLLLARGFHPFSQTDLPPGRTAIVILGGGGDTVRAGSLRLGIMYDDTGARLLEGFRVYALSGADWIISSGGVTETTKPHEPTATMMRDALVKLGVPASKILLESVSQDTHDEAVLVGQMLRTLGADHVVLVTSDIHMRRSLGAFRSLGLQPIPAIAPDGCFPETLRQWVTPTNHGLEYTRAVVHELLGIAYYAARGWFAFRSPAQRAH
jgi:uncharacterized SAM-binding protein YcdF (DUF218 family)